MDHPRPVLALAALLLLALTGRSTLRADPAVPPAGTRPAEPNSFAEVSAQLDPGGSFFMYLSTESWLKGLSDELAAARDLPGTAPREKREAYLRNFSFIVDGLRASGLEDLTGIGVSSFPISPELTRQKSFLHHAAGHSQGFLWSLLGSAPHSFAGLALLPSKTALASFSDIDPAQLATLVHQAFGRLNQPALEQMYQQAMAQLSAATGLPAEEALRSLTGTAGFILTLDPETKVQMPINGDKSASFPRPALALLLPAKDDRIYQQLAKMVEANPGTIRTDEGELHLRVATEMAVVPELKLHPAVAHWKEWLIIASDESLVRDIIAAQAGGQGFTSSPEFAKLSAGLPKEGNSFQITTTLFGQTLHDIQLAMMQSPAEMQGPPQLVALQKALAANYRQSSYAVFSNLPTGWLTVANLHASGPPHPFGTMLGSLISGLLQSAPATPAPEAQAKTPGHQSLSQARQLALACHMYAGDHDGKFPATLQDLVPNYVPDASVLKSPFAPDDAEGYQYTPGLTESSPPATVLLEDKQAAKKHEHVAIQVDGTAVLE